VLSQGAKIEQAGTSKELIEKPANKFVQKLLGL
jgi:ABC-type sugar transport system ATPase subunit